MSILFPAAGAVCLFSFLKNRLQGASAKSLLWKAGTSLCFMALAFFGLWGNVRNGNGVAFSLLVTAGLFFGLLGDIWLDLKWNCPAENDPYTFAGFWCFAAGHVCFLTAMIRYGGVAMRAPAIAIPLILAVILGIAVGMGGKLLSLDYGKFKGITMLYGALLIGTTLLSASFVFCTQGKVLRFLLLCIGAVLFLISDLILSGTYFGEGKDRPADIVSNHVFYYAAQFFIAFSILVL
ncbi:MAG: lysoplasmalogenase [Eubacterium sp.]|nr:lysoplasmalogenase [Eubacterium sp.]